MSKNRCSFLFLMLGFAPFCFAQKITLRGLPLSVACFPGVGFNSAWQLAVVIWDGDRKLLVSGASKQGAKMAQVVALLLAEIEDGDDEEILLECTRRPALNDGGLTQSPSPRHSGITRLVVEGFSWQGHLWSLQ